MQGSSCIRRRTVLGLLSSASLAGWPALAQEYSRPDPHAIDAVVDFDIEAGKVTQLEHEYASQRLRGSPGYLGIRFQIEKSYSSDQWAPILGLTLEDETGDRGIKLDFADLPVSKHLLIVAERITRSTRQVVPLVKVHAPVFTRHEVHDVVLAITPTTVDLIIRGQRRSLARDFDVYKLVVRPSGIKGWISFPRAGSV